MFTVANIVAYLLYYSSALNFTYDFIKQYFQEIDGFMHILLNSKKVFWVSRGHAYNVSVSNNKLNVKPWVPDEKSTRGITRSDSWKSQKVFTLWQSKR